MQIWVREVLAGLVAALVLIPQAISFSVIAGVDPASGLIASAIMATVTAVLGGRPAMISAATGAIAFAVAPVVERYGEDALLLTVLMAGIAQIILALVGVHKLLRFVTPAVLDGFVNALAAFVFLAQLPHLINVPWAVYLLVGLGLLVAVLFPLWSKAIPGTLVSIVFVTVSTLVLAVSVPTVSDQGELLDTLPSFEIPSLIADGEMLLALTPFALTMALVGLLESLLTARILDRIDGQSSNLRREGWAQGVANLVTSLFGGMGGCAEIGPSILNVKTNRARTRLSSFLAGSLLFVMVILASDVLAIIPMAALVSVMLVVSFTTFRWQSFAATRLKSDWWGFAVMLITFSSVMASGNLALGVVIGAALAFAKTYLGNRSS